MLISHNRLDSVEVPFIEINRHKKIKTVKMSGEKTIIEFSEKQLHDGITEYCKKNLCDLIIEKGELASQKLLKLTVAYRFIYDNYSGNESAKGCAIKDIADDEELEYIGAIVRCIIKEYNFLRKELKIEFSQNEIDTGIFEELDISSIL